MSEKVFEPLGITAAYQASRLAPDVPVADLYYMPQRRLAKRVRKETPALRDYCFTAAS